MFQKFTFEILNGCVVISTPEKAKAGLLGPTWKTALKLRDDKLDQFKKQVAGVIVPKNVL